MRFCGIMGLLPTTLNLLQCIRSFNQEAVMSEYKSLPGQQGRKKQTWSHVLGFHFIFCVYDLSCCVCFFCFCKWKYMCFSNMLGCMEEHVHLCSHCSNMHWLSALPQLFQETATSLFRNQILSSPRWWLFFPDHLNHHSGSTFLSGLGQSLEFPFQYYGLLCCNTVYHKKTTNCNLVLCFLE